MPVSVLKRISKLLDFKKKRRFSFFGFFVDFKKKTVGSKCCHLQPSTQPRRPPWEREEVKWTGEKERKKQREMVDA